MKIYQSTFHRQKPMLIMSNSSERGDFVPMIHIATAMNRIHDGIQLLKAYYPREKSWSYSQKISEITDKTGINYQWDYEYEDYHPFNLIYPGGDTKQQFESIKCFGSDIHLTLTMDLSLSDEEISEVVKSLSPYGRLFLRINHECNGNWFRYNKYHSYKEVNDFFVRCHKIVKANASNIFTVFSLSADFFAHDKIIRNCFLRIEKEEMKEAMELADYWSLDKYVSLHYAWPFEEKVNRADVGKTFFQNSVEQWWILVEECYLNLCWANGLKMKPLFINEFNSDSDVDGLEAQAEIVGSVYNRIVRGDFPWLAGIAFYQFRDYGGLGLEKGNLYDYQENPVLIIYRNMINQIRYQIRIEDWEEWHHNAVYFSWYHTDSLRGLCIRDVQNVQRFINHFTVPVYIVEEEDQHWIRLKPGHSCRLKEAKQFFLMIPPYLDEKGQLQYALKADNIKTNLLKMMGIKDEIHNEIIHT